MTSLTNEQFEILRQKLLDMKEQISERLRSVGEQARPVQLSDPIGRLARMDALQSQQMARTQRRRDEAQFMMVSAALSRIREGVYGDCLRCEEPIGFERLQVSPETSLCVSCRQSSERR